MINYKLIHLSEIDSTNEFILSLKNSNFFKEGLVVSADFQQKGRGYLSNNWESEVKKNLLVSILLEPKLKLIRQFKINQLISMSILDLLKSYSIEAKIKWPNDILVKKSKVAGILIQNIVVSNSITYSIAGIGININQNNFQSYSPKADSLSSIVGKKLNINKVRDDLLYFVQNRIKDLRRGVSFDNQYKKNLYMINQKCCFKEGDTEFDGVIVGVSSVGELCVKIQNDFKYFKYKQIKYLF